MELLDRFDQRVGAAPAAADALPRREEPNEGRRVDRLDLVAQRGQRTPAQGAQHAGVAPLALDAAGAELAVHDPARGFEAGHCLAGALGGDPEPRGDVVDDERNVRAREAGDEIVERMRDRIGERGRQARGERDAERVTQPRRVFDRGEPRAGADHAAFGQQRIDPRGRVGRAARTDLVVVERTEVGEQVVEVVGVAGLARRNEPLELELQLRDHCGVEQLPELFGAEQVAEQIAIERERGDAAFGEGRVALVHVHRDPAEQQALRER